MKYYKYLWLMLVLFLSSCGTIDKFLPSIALQHKNQNNTSSSTSTGNGPGRDLKAKVNLIAGANKAKNYDNSNIKSKDLNSDLKLDQGTSATNFGGKHTDNSHKTITSKISKDNKQNSYLATEQKINYNANIATQITDAFKSWVDILLGALCFFAGWKSHKSTANYIIKRKYKSKNK